MAFIRGMRAVCSISTQSIRAAAGDTDIERQFADIADRLKWYNGMPLTLSKIRAGRVIGQMGPENRK